MEILWIFIGFIFGSIITPWLFFRKKMEELTYHRAKELEMFNPIEKTILPEENGTIETENLTKIYLEKASNKLNAAYENDLIVINFNLGIEMLSQIFDLSPLARDRYMRIVKKKIERGEAITIPQGILDIKKLEPIFRKGAISIYSKEDKKYLDYILTGKRNISLTHSNAEAIEIYYCLPNGKVISKISAGFVCGIH